MSSQDEPVCWIIAGPNGAGKTTFALKFLPEVAACRYFVNADLIAAGLSPLAPEAELMMASRLFLKEINSHIAARHDFGFETTLSGRGYLRLVKRLRAEGWRVELIYLALPDVEMSKMRVAERVAHGGHNIPTETVERRFPRSLWNLLHNYTHEVDRTRCFLNSGEVPDLVFVQQGQERELVQSEIYNDLLKEANP
jgi:predicted ABC-type ATPase